jgi:Uma2 family endonuclease
MPHLKKAELIEGVVYVASPVNMDRHGDPHMVLTTWAGFYRAYTPGVRGADNTTIRLDNSNEPQPDVLLMIDQACGGRARVIDGYAEGGPELLVEISASSVRADLGPRMEAYRRAHVQEYVVWRVEHEEIDWFVLREGGYQLLTQVGGIYRSEVFPGLWLDAAAVVQGDLVRMIDMLQQGLASQDHADFVSLLREKRKAP